MRTHDTNQVHSTIVLGARRGIPNKTRIDQGNRNAWSYQDLNSFNIYLKVPCNQRSHVLKPIYAQRKTWNPKTL